MVADAADHARDGNPVQAQPALRLFQFKSKNLLFGLVLATMMVPMQVTIVPVFMLIRGMGLADTLLALIIPALPTALGTFLMRQYFMGLPAELGEAAEIDGAGPWKTFFGIYLPLSTPAWPSSESSPSTSIGTNSSDR